MRNKTIYVAKNIPQEHHYAALIDDRVFSADGWGGENSNDFMRYEHIGSSTEDVVAWVRAREEMDKKFPHSRKDYKIIKTQPVKIETSISVKVN